MFLPWLGWRDSNPRMAGPEPAALPLGDIPIPFNYIKKNFSFQGFLKNVTLTFYHFSVIIKNIKA